MKQRRDPLGIEDDLNVEILSLTVVPGAKEISTEKAIDRLEPLPGLWWENDDGEVRLPTDEEMKGGYVQPEGFPLMHSRNPEVRESYFNEDGKEIGVFNTTINCIGDIVMYLMQEKGWSLVDAVTLGASTCERCMNILIEESGGEKYDQHDKESCHTHCDLCKTVDPEYDRWYNEVWQKHLDDKNRTDLATVKES